MIDELMVKSSAAINKAASYIYRNCYVSVGNSAKPVGVDAKWISECAKDLKANAGKSLVVAGNRQPLVVHLLAHAINAALGCFRDRP